MVHVLAWWVAFQLAFIGYIGSDVLRQIDEGVYVCKTEYHMDNVNDYYIFMAVPLIFFVPEPPEVIRYCEQQRKEFEDGIY